MLLIINLCKEKFHENEFVRPIENLIKENFKTVNYKKLTSKDLDETDKIIICGTALKDFDYLDNLNNFEWIKHSKKLILGICAGSQIIHLLFGGKLVDNKEIGQIQTIFNKDFLGIKKGIHKVYTLHKKTSFSKDFDVYAESGQCLNASKHRKKEVYTCLFHPEVYNQEIIENFIKL